MVDRTPQTLSACALFLFLLLFAPYTVSAQQVKVTAEVERDGVVGTSLEGTITITHNRSDAVDSSSFRLGDEKLDVEFLKEVPLSRFSELVISIYKFELVPKEPGLHVLPEVTVSVGNREYRSVQSTYTVEKEGAAQPAPPSRPSKQPQRQIRTTVILELENIIEGKQTLYPGQQLVVGYRFLYNFSVDLTKEELPLLEAEGLRKVGAKDTKEFKEGELNHLEVRQIVEAAEPGEYRYPGGVIEGVAYQIDRLGKKHTAPSPSRAESSPVTIDVLPFPEKDQPPSFNGAVGTSLALDVSLLGKDTMTVGDKMTLLIRISGEGEFDSISLPEVCCQPGFSGFFRLSDLPPLEEKMANSKSFRVEMRPLSASIEEIPSLEFTYFNPEKKAYVTLKSDPIPVAVNPLQGEPTEEQRRVLFEEPKQQPDAPEEEKPILPKAIEIEGNYPLSASDLESRTFGTWWVLLIIPFGIAFLFLEVHLRNFLIEQMSKEKVRTSRDYFEEAMQKKPESSAFFNLIQKAFLLRLEERGEIASAETSPDYLPGEGTPGKVKALIRRIEEKRFAASGGEFEKEFIAEIRQLFRELKPGQGSKK